MTLPKYDEMYKPLLESLKNGNEHTVKEINDFIAKYLNISDEEWLEMTPSGKLSKFRTRANWTRVYLKKAGLIKNTSRGVFIITDEGQNVLESSSIINNDSLMKYDSF
ncbi:MAG: winged helix-turn-helix domain-containing protein [Methanosarcinales archaeon]|nr:winged helix-turn-helix domain-containing protein [Methanosarcinales archaeon]